jgi:hypothetical protein
MHCVGMWLFAQTTQTTQTDLIRSLSRPCWLQDVSAMSKLVDGHQNWRRSQRSFHAPVGVLGIVAIVRGA